MAIDEKQSGLLKHKAKIAVIVHGILLVLLLLLLVFIVPLFQELFEGNSGSLPHPTQHVFRLSELVRQYIALVIPMTAGLLWLDARIYSRLVRRHGARPAKRWSWGVILTLIVPWLYCVWALALPFCVVRQMAMDNPQLKHNQRINLTTNSCAIS